MMDNREKNGDPKLQLQTPGDEQARREAQDNVQPGGQDASRDGAKGAEVESRPETVAREEHLVRRPGISAQVLAEAKVRQVSANEADGLCGLEAAGIWMPYFTYGGTRQEDGGKQFGTLRLDLPKDDMKYFQGRGTRPHVGIPPALAGLSPGGSLALVEGYFKAISLTESGFKACGITGFYGFKVAGQDGRDALPEELAEVLNALHPETIHYVGDNDTAFNPDFAKAAVRLAHLLKRPIYCPRLPIDGPGKGVDDCRAAMGDERFIDWWGGLVDDSIEVKPDDSWQDVCLTFLESAIEGISNLKGRVLEKSQRGLGRLGLALSTDPLRYRRLEGLCKNAGINKGGLRDLVRYAREAVAAEAGEKVKSQMHGCLGSGVYEQIVADEGEPFTIGRGRIVGVNWPFFVQMFTFKHHIVYCRDEGAFFLYQSDTGLWVETSEASIRTMFSDDMREFGRNVELAQQVAEMRDFRSLNDLAKLLKGACEVERYWEQGQGSGTIHLQNGMLDLNSGAPDLRDFSPEWRSRNRTPLIMDKAATCPRFLDEVLLPNLNPDDLSLFQRWAGLALLGGNPAQLVMVLKGEAGTGKGLTVSLLTRVIGEDSCAELRTDLLDGRFEVGRLVGKRLLVGPDVPRDFLANKGAQRIKALVGGDRLDGELKGSNRPLPCRGNFDIIITTNADLTCRVDGDLTAWHRRLLIIDFSGAPSGKPIPNFENTLLENEGAGILNWLIQGAIQARSELNDHGHLLRTVEQENRVDALLDGARSVEQFVEILMRPDANTDVSCSEAEAAYASFCATRGWSAWPPRQARAKMVDAVMRRFNVPESHSIKLDARSVRGWHKLRIASFPMMGN